MDQAHNPSDGAATSLMRALTSLMQGDASDLSMEHALVLTIPATILFMVAFLLVRSMISVTTGSVKRSTTLLLGLPFSGKTALFYQLVKARAINTRTSMEANRGVLCEAYHKGSTQVVDFPGYRRLRPRLFTELREAREVIVVVDSVTIQDDRNDGAAAISELILDVVQSPEFVGVKRLLFACNKRDELTSYSSQAVRKLLEQSLTKSITSGQGNVLGRLETVKNSSGTVIGSAALKKNAKRRRGATYTLEIDQETNRFSFDQMDVPVEFVDVSCVPSADHKFNVEGVVDFIASA